MTMRILREKQCSVGGRGAYPDKGCLSKEGARPQKRFFSALRASIWPKNTERWSGSLLGGVS